jgi:transposase
MSEYEKHGIIKRASMMAGMDRKTGRKYLRAGKLPSEMKIPERDYRTRKDPFEEDWEELRGMLKAAPALEAKALFGWLQERNPRQYHPGQLRTFQRKVQRWRAMEGPDKRVYFGQCHIPGEAFQVDFTNCNELEITIEGDVFEHLLCHSVLPYSNWEWATVCRSESFLALRGGTQAALFRIGHVTEYMQTDSLSAATHELGEGKRGFNQKYEDFVGHYGMKPRRIGVGQSNQNGDVEAANGALKRCLKQHLLLRGSRDFESVEAYESWVQGVMTKNNDLRRDKVKEELKHMRPLTAPRLAEYRDETVHVCRESTIRVMQNSYSVPSRLIGEKVKVRIYEDRLEVYYGGRQQLCVARLLGRNSYRIDYRHIIWSLVQRPGAFPRYRYRQELFPGMIFRRTYDLLCARLGKGYKADLEYLRILHRAASVSEEDVICALEMLIAENELPLADKVKDLVQPREAEIPDMSPFTPSLQEYDALLDFAQEGSR